MSGTLYNPIYSSSWAVLIGVDEYQDPNIANLRGPVSDAEELGDVLVSTCEFPEDHVTVLTDQQATKAAIRDALEYLTGNWVDPDDRILIFFSGHGVVRSGRVPTYYLVPTDAQFGDWNTFVSQESFLVTCRHIPAKHVLFVLDACHSGSFVRESKQVALDLEEMLKHPAWQAIGASLPDQLALDAGSDRHSLFTQHLLRGLRGEAARSDGVLTFSHLAVFVRDNVALVNKKQVPIFGYLPHSGPGEFIFHFESSEEIPQDIAKALLSQLTRTRLSAVWELKPKQ